MNAKLWILVATENAGVNAVLAAEALRGAAEKSGIDAAVLKPEEYRDALAGNPDPADRLLLVGDAAPPARFAGLATVRVTVADVLRDPAAALALKPEISPAGAPGEKSKRIVAVTSCPTGIAHTFMAAEGLQKAAEALGYGIRIETQGSVGSGTPLTPEEIAAADLVMIAADREVDRSRFSGKPVFASNTKQAITDGQNLIRQALAEAVVQTAEESASPAAEQSEKKAGPYKHLMTGVSFMLPFVVAGGLLIALAFALGGINAGDQEGTLAQLLMTIGGKGGFALMIPVLSGYIAYSVADRPGIAPGMIGGVMCSLMGAGFLGGIVSGFIAGYGVYYLNRFIVLPKNLAGLKPVLILPLFGTLLTCLVLHYGVGGPTAQINVWMTEWLKGLQGTGSVALGLLIGGMMAVDLGGPVNKAAYAFSTGMLEAGVHMPMAAAMAAGMTPPLAAALATRLFRNRFSEEEREAGSAAFVLGLAFVSEGAIPFAARDPLRVIPAFIIGSAVTGAISMGLGIQLMAPHGGVFVLAIPNAVSNVVWYAFAIAVGTVVSALIMGILKKPAHVNAAAVSAAKGAVSGGA